MLLRLPLTVCVCVLFGYTAATLVRSCRPWQAVYVITPAIFFCGKCV